MRFVAKAEGDQRLHILAMLGHEVPLHASSIGKAWLATLPEGWVLALITKQGMRRFTSRTVTPVEVLLRELRAIAGCGYATVIEEILDGVAGAGMAIAVGTRPVVVGGVSIVGPLLRMPPDRLAQLPDMLRLAVGDLAARHGVDRARRVREASRMSPAPVAQPRT